MQDTWYRHRPCSVTSETKEATPAPSFQMFRECSRTRLSVILSDKVIRWTLIRLKICCYLVTAWIAVSWKPSHKWSVWSGSPLFVCSPFPVVQNKSRCLLKIYCIGNGSTCAECNSRGPRRHLWLQHSHCQGMSTCIWFSIIPRRQWQH